RTAAGNVERPHAHAIKEAMILRGVGGGIKNGIFERHNKALRHLGGGGDGSSEVDVFKIKAHASTDEAVVEHHGESIAGGDGGEQSPRIAAIVEVVAPIDRLSDDGVGAGYNLRRFRGVHRPRPQSVAYALQGKFVLRVEE